jgi:arylsulfatase A-like enzyme
MTRAAAHVRFAIGVGAVGGAIFGMREALLTVAANDFVQPAQYFAPYVAMPILSCMLLGALLLLPCGVMVAARGGAQHPATALPFYAAVLVLGGALSITLPWISDITAQLRDVGVSASPAVRVVLGLLAVAPAAAASIVGWAAATRWTMGSRPVVFRYAGWAATVLALVLLVPVVRFAVTDWTWEVRAPVAQANATRPNVVLISIDTLRADHLGSYGDGRGLTPHLDRLAADGVVFRQAITAAPWTLPAMASILTGLAPRDHGAGRIANGRDPLARSPLAPGVRTLAGTLREQGYWTHAIVTNPYLTLRYGLGAGFDGYENLTVESEFFLAGRKTTANRLLAWLWPDLVVGDRGTTVSARAENWLARTGPPRPFFLWLHYIDPHAPYSAAGVARQKSFRTDSLLAPQANMGGGTMLTSPDVARLRSGEIRLSAAEREGVRALYADEVRTVDAAVGRVLAALDQRGLRDSTLVVCVGDHGEEFWEHGGVEHGHTVYDELIRVPLLLRWPGHLPPGEGVDAVTRVIDIVPTVLELLGVPPERTDGASLLPLIRGEEREPRVAVVENLLFAEERVGIRTADRKYVRWERGKEEVYDLAADPREQRDLAGTDAIVAPLRALWAARERETLPAAAAAHSPPRAMNAPGLRRLGDVP